METISAIAQPTAMLELLPSLSNGESILRQILPVYGRPVIEYEENLRRASIMPAADKLSKNAALDNVPLSSEEFEACWIQLCAFEHEGLAWLPIPILTLQIWKSVLSAATATCVDLGRSFSTEDILELVAEEGYPVPLTRAVFRRIQSDGNDLMDGCKWIRI